MVRTVEAIIDEKGVVHLRESVNLPGVRRALVTILEESAAHVQETVLLSETTLKEDWERPEEDEAWSHLQQER